MSVSLVLAQLLKIPGNQREVLYQLKTGMFFKFWGQTEMS